MPHRPRGRPRKNLPPTAPDSSTNIHDVKADPCPHVARNEVLQPKYLQYERKASEMEIGLANDEFFDSQEQDFYFHDYNNEDEQE